MGTASTAAAVLTLYSTAKVLRLCPAWLAVFESPATVLGSVMLFLCLLIISNKYYYSRGDQHRLAYFQRNAAFLVAAVVAIAMGSVFGMTGPATTFLVLWCLEKYCEIHFEAGWNAWVLLLLLSAVMYKAALWLHAHPAFVASLFLGFSQRDDAAVVPLP